MLGILWRVDLLAVGSGGPGNGTGGVTLLLVGGGGGENPLAGTIGTTLLSGGCPPCN